MAREFDHFVLCVRNLDAARQAFAGMGFTLTPRARHPFGTENSNIQLQGNFVELLSVAAPEDIPAHGENFFSFAAFNHDFLKSGEGMSMLVFRSANAIGDAEEFRLKGLSDFEPFQFSRQAKQPDGEEVKVGFTLAFVTHIDMPDAVFFTCQQHAPQYFWKPTYQRHPNTARAVTQVFMLADDPSHFASFFEALFGAAQVTIAETMLIVDTGEGKLYVVTHAAYERIFNTKAPPTPFGQAAFAAITVEVDDLESLVGCVRDSQFVYYEHNEAVIIDATNVFGVLIEFAETSR